MTKLPGRLQKPLVVGLGLSAAALLASCSQSGIAASPSSASSTSASSTSAPSTSTSSASPSPSPSTAASASPSTTPSTSAQAPSTSAGRRVDVTVTGKQVSPDPATVNIAVGESLTIAVTSDHDDRLHVHGFEIAKDIKAGQRLEIMVKGGPPGVYDFELHNPELRLFQVAVR